MATDEKTRLTREALVDQAVALADAEGLDAVTIRRLADQLGVSPMALYWHVKNKDQLLAAMADRLLGEVTPERDPAEPWDRQLRAMVTALLRVMRSHPCAPALLAACDKVEVPSFTRATETALSLLSQAGFTLAEGFVIASQLLDGTIGLVDRQPVCAPGRAMAEFIEQRRQHRLAMESLPADTYPNMVRYAATMEAAPDPEEYYAFGVDLLVAGVVAMAAGRSTRSPAGSRRAAGASRR